MRDPTSGMLGLVKNATQPTADGPRETPRTSRLWTTTKRTLAKDEERIMTQLHNPHPGEILKEEFLKEIGMSQNQLAYSISGRAIAFMPSLMGPATSQATPICAYANSSACRRAISCACRMPMTPWKPSGELPLRLPKSSRTNRKRQPEP